MTLELVPLAVIISLGRLQFAVGLPLRWAFPGIAEWLEAGISDL